MDTLPNSKIQTGFFRAGIALLAVLLGIVVLPTLNLGLVGDDYFLLVNDRGLPLTQSIDQLHRPLRNIVLKSMGSLIGIHHVLAYRILVAGTFLAVLVFLFMLLRRMKVSSFAALAGVFVVAFYPRNREVLFWFAAWQDLVAAAAVLVACLLFLKYREAGSTYTLWSAAIVYGIALGFKETAVVVLVFLLLIDLYRSEHIRELWQRRLWHAYIPLVCVLLIYVIYFFADSGWASLAGRRTGGFYGFKNISSVLSGVARAVIGLLLPFSGLLGLKSVRPWHVVVILFELGTAAVLAWRSRQWRALLLAAAWVLCAILPTAAFAGIINADRYLLVPMLGVGILVALLVHQLTGGPRPIGPVTAVSLLCLVYSLSAVGYLVRDRQEWRRGGEEATAIIRDTVEVGAKLPANSELDVANVTPIYESGAAVLGNGLSEALHADGLSRSIRVIMNPASKEPEQIELTARLQRCAIGTAERATARRIVLIEIDGHILPDRGECGAEIVDNDRTRRPRAWTILYP